MNVDGRLVEEKLRQAPGYVKMFEEVYGREPTYGNTLDALSAFVASLKSGESPYDRFAGGDKNALGEDAARGYELFNGKAGCAACHAGPQFSDGKLHRRKVPENPEIFKSPLRHISFRRFFRMLGVEDYPTMREDIGYEAISKKRADNRTFRTPSLREAARTGPYMHNGAVKTLDEAVRLENPSLTDLERKDIVAFLKSLSGPLLDIEEPALPPYGVEPYEEMKWPPRTTPVEERKTAAFPPLAPLGPVPVPDDNPQTSEKAALGAFLFFDERTSGNGHTGCAGCHIPLAGWGDMEKLSRNYTSTMHFRNTQTILNAAYFTKLNWDGARLSLEDQAHDAILSAISHNADPVMVEERLAQEPEYVKRFKEVFGVERPTLDAMLKAISAFMREKAISKNVPFDLYAKGDEAALSPEEKRGMELFNGKAGCIRCHNGPLASDENFYDTGVPIPPHFFKVPLLQITLRYIHKGRGVPEEVYRRARTDPGLYLETKNADDVGKFRTASLRELKYTAPYMHNGVFDTLEKVVDFYNDGGGASRNKTPLLKPLGLSASEKTDLVAFLESLSSREVVDAVRPPSDDMAYGASPYVDYFAEDGEYGEKGNDDHAR